MVVIGTVVVGLAIFADQGVRQRHRRTVGGNHLADSADPGGALRGGARRDDGRVVARRVVEVKVDRGRHRVAFVVLLLTHSRTALIAMLAGILVGGLSLFLSRKRVRRAFVVAIVVVGIGALSFAPLITGWFDAGSEQLRR